MKKDWVRTLLTDCITRRSPIEILRKKLDVPPLCCVPLLMSEKLVLVVPYVDFQPDGYEVIRLRDISSIRADERAAFHGHIMMSEGVLESLCLPPVSLESFSALLTDLFAQGEPVIVSGKEGPAAGHHRKGGQEEAAGALHRRHGPGGRGSNPPALRRHHLRRVRQPLLEARRAVRGGRSEEE